MEDIEASMSERLAILTGNYQTHRSIMANTTLRVNPESYRIIKMLSDRRGVSLVEALDEIVRAWERDHFFQEFNAAYAALKADSAARTEELEERSAWDATLIDSQE